MASEMINLQKSLTPLAMEFRWRMDKASINDEKPKPDGAVAFYGISKEGNEYGEMYENVDEMIVDFEKVLSCAKDFKEKYGINRGNS